MYHRLPRAVLPRGILLCHIFLGEPAFSNHNGAKGRNLSQGAPWRGMVRASPYTPGNHHSSGMICSGRPGPTMRDRLILQILSVQVDVPLLVVNFPVVTRFFLSWMIISPSEIPTYFAETYNGYTNWQRGDFDEGSTRCGLEQSRYLLGTSNVLSSSRQIRNYDQC
jgi:hypothetical protein